MLKFSNIQVSENLELEVTSTKSSDVKLKGKLNVLGGLSIPGVLKQDGRHQTVSFSDQATLNIEEQENRFYTVTWTPLSPGFAPEDCLSLASGGLWFGGAEVYTQHWPANKQQNKMVEYVSGDLFQGPFYGSVLERFWVSSHGVGIYVPTEVPLHVSWNDGGNGEFHLRASYEGHTYPNPEGKYPALQYIICVGSDVKDVHQKMFRKFFERPQGLPDLRMMQSPIWSTWVRYKKHVTELDVLELADEIEKHGFSSSQIEIDDMYTSHYGEFNFDTKKFPNGKKLIKTLHDRGFRVTAWITPFANTDSLVFDEGVKKGYWIKEASGRTAALTKWWQGEGGILDVSNPQAVAWYIARLRAFMEETGMDAYKFDAGEVNWLPQPRTTHSLMPNPTEYATRYVAAVTELGGPLEVRVGYRSQKHPVFVRMMDKDSRWGHDNGLATMVPNALLMGLLGYHYCLPDMIGGNGYESAGLALESSRLPGRELFIRWTALSAYLPAMQFSFVPWQYDEETVNIARDMVQQHEKIVYPRLLKAAEEAVATGAPIVRPLWWLDPTDPDALACGTQYLLGPDLLVAPILEDGGRTRRVYLPRGLWTDQLRGGQVTGPRWLDDYRVDLHEIATFILEP